MLGIEQQEGEVSNQCETKLSHRLSLSHAPLAYGWWKIYKSEYNYLLNFTELNFFKKFEQNFGEKMEKLISLHKHWINADAIKQVIATKINDNSKLPDELHIEAEMHSAFARLSILYGLIYVVIEGYQELKYRY